MNNDLPKTSGSDTSLFVRKHPMTDEQRAREIDEAVALLMVGLSHPPTMFYTRTDQFAKATQTVLTALREARAAAIEEAARWVEAYGSGDSIACYETAQGIRALDKPPTAQEEG